MRRNCRAALDCENGGEEVLDGVLSADSSVLYSGAFLQQFPLTSAGEGPRTERLENYLWMVELN